jgi:thiol-disulfide isomerase/thioredoxin
MMMKVARNLVLGLVCCTLGCSRSTDDGASGTASTIAVPESVDATQLQGDQNREPDPITIGSIAPSLNVEHWPNASWTPVTQFEPGQVYVVEFWATWCGPCLLSMPHLAELQSEYADQGVRIVSITQEDLETVAKFLDKPVNPAILKRHAADEDDSDSEHADDEETTPPTYSELTSAYSLTADPDGSTYRDYMKAAKQNGIPCAFIVGRDGHVEWIGHPMAMDQPLASVVAGDWDRVEAKAEFIREEQRSTVFREIMMAQRSNKFDQALNKLQEHEELFAGSRYEPYLAKLKFEAALHNQDTAAILKEIQSKRESQGDNVSAVNAWAWTVYEAVAAGYPDDAEIVAATIDALESAIAASDSEFQWAAIDTLAHLKAHAGDVEAAIELQTQAIELAPKGNTKPLEAYLDQLTEELSEGEGLSEDEDPAAEEE